MLNRIYQTLRQSMDQVISRLKEDFASVRTGRANAGLVENISIDYLGTPVELKKIASITLPDASSIVIQPWDKNVLGAIEQAISASDIGLNPVNDGSVIRLKVPPMTSERRQELVDSIHEKAEAAKVALRTLRKEAWEQVQVLEKSKQITEDDRYAAEKELNKIIDDFNGKVDSVTREKINQISAI